MGWEGEGERRRKCGKRVCDTFTYYNKSHFKICTTLTIFASLFECTLSTTPLASIPASALVECGESNMSKPVNKNHQVPPANNTSGVLEHKWRASLKQHYC